MIYIITATHGHYEDRCDIRMYASEDLDDARAVMLELQQSIIAAMDMITAIGCDGIVNCSEVIWNIAYSAHFEGRVHLGISGMELGLVSNGGMFIEGVYAESAHEFLYNRDVYDYVPDELPRMSKYEVLAVPYEAKYYGHKH